MTNICTWHKHVPFKYPFLLPRALRGKMPTNKKLTYFGHNPSYCHCCHIPGPDTIKHIMVSGYFARNIWKFLYNSLGVNIH